MTNVRSSCCSPNLNCSTASSTFRNMVVASRSRLLRNVSNRRASPNSSLLSPVVSVTPSYTYSKHLHFPPERRQQNTPNPRIVQEPWRSRSTFQPRLPFEAISEAVQTSTHKVRRLVLPAIVETRVARSGRTMRSEQNRPYCFMLELLCECGMTTLAHSVPSG